MMKKEFFSQNLCGLQLIPICQMTNKFINMINARSITALSREQKALDAPFLSFDNSLFWGIKDKF